MPESTESKEKETPAAKKSVVKKKDQPNVLILFRVKENTPWAVFPRLFNNEETALTKLEQSYPFEEHFFQTLDLP